MSKLRKREVNAIASKLRRNVEEKVRLEKLRAIHEYIPCQEYLEVQANFDRIQEICKKLEALKAEREAIGKNINKVFDKLGVPRTYWNWWECPDEACIEEKLEEIVKIEIKVPSVPSIEELKEDITIAAIDSDFDVEDFIKSRLENDYRGS